MNIKLLGAFAAVALLAACAKPAATQMSTGNGAAMTTGPAPGSEEDLVANVGDRVFYGFNASSLSTDATTTLSHQAGWLQKFPQIAVLVAGNCDPRGTEEYNLALGRAPSAQASWMTAVPTPPATTWWPRASMARASRPSATARIGRSHRVATRAPTRRTATPSPPCRATTRRKAPARLPEHGEGRPFGRTTVTIMAGTRLPAIFMWDLRERRSLAQD